MGLLDFVKDAGAKLTGGETPSERGEGERLDNIKILYIS
jgi:hypothetical protein